MLDLLLAFAVLIVPLLLAWALIGRALDGCSPPRGPGRGRAFFRRSAAAPTSGDNGDTGPHGTTGARRRRRLRLDR